MDEDASNQKRSSLEPETSRKRGTLENLSKEELILKCKGLLGLAQKAKQAKDEYAEKNKMLIIKLSEFETQKEADKGALLTMKEIIDNLTANKLILISKITDLESTNEQLISKITLLENFSKNVDEISIENEALKRQLKRLTDENEDLINDLEKMEGKFLKTSKEYSEHETNNAKLIQEANVKLDALKKQINESKFDNQDVSEKSNIESPVRPEFSDQLERLKNNEIKLLEEIQHLKNKINDVALKFKKLKGCRKVLMENEKDYSESVSKWQKDIKKVSERLLAYIHALQNDKRELSNRLRLYEELHVSDMEIKNIDNMQLKLKNLTQICEKVFKDSEEQIKNIEELRSIVLEKKNMNEKLTSEIESLRLNIPELNEKDSTNNKDFPEKIENCFENLKEQNSVLLRTIEDYKFVNNQLELKNNELVVVLKSSQQNIENLNNKIQILNKELEKTIGTEMFLKEEIRDLMENADQKNSSFKKTIQDNIESVDRLKAENTELLNEMRELNEALKTRGDLISKQQNSIISLEAEIQKLSNQSSSQIEFKDRVTNPTSKDIQATMLVDTQNDGSSLCSITKTEDSIRLQEANDSLEEKYNKLKVLALKMKRKIQEQKVIITNFEENKSKIIDPTLDHKQNTTSNQSNIDADKDTENYKLELNSFNKKVTEQEKRILLLENSIETLNKTITEKEQSLINEIKLRKSKEQIITDISKEIKLYKQEKDAFNLIRKELEKENEGLKTKMSDKTKEILKLNEMVDKLKKEVEKSKAIGKQSSMLNLEIEAYEKSLNENAEKLTSLKALNQELNESLQFKDGVILSLKEEIKLLEESISSEKQHSTDMKDQVDLIQTKLKNLEHQNQDMQSKLEEYTVDNEKKHSQLEDLRLQIVDISSEKEKEISEISKEKEVINVQLFKTEEKLKQTENKLKAFEIDIESIRTEYASYKIRAQSVLRQNQNKETSRERELEEELTTIQTDYQNLNLKLTKKNELVESQEKRIDELKQEVERTQKHSKELMGLLEESREQYESLLEENRKQSKDYQESLKAHRLQIETLTQCYKNQLIELEEKHNKIVDELKKNQLIGPTSASRVGPFGGSGVAEQSVKSSDEHKVEMLLMEREDAEGSEASYTLSKRKTSTTRNKHDMIPLDELLNSPLDESSEQLFGNEEDKISAETEIIVLKEKLQEEESKSKHLTSLLSETEQDLIKYTQLSEVLKEELRRQERTLEREKHMPNSEYLKNVILKFLTLSSGDERLRLVPVLNTILKLSPDEASALQNVAKSVETSRSWNLLPMWSNN